MNKITFVTVLLLLVAQLSLAQDKYSRVKINNPDQRTLRTIATNGIDLSCGAHHEHNSLTLELSETEIEDLRNNNIPFSIEIDDLTKFYSERLKNDKSVLNKKPTVNTNNYSSQQRGSISNVVQDNYLQYVGCDEVNWVQPSNFHFGTMGNCLTISEMLTELDEMNAYDATNGLNIVSARQDASPTGQKTWGNPNSTITNPQDNGPSSYIGIGTTRWDPQTINYIRITGNESTTPENTKPQILFTSMIHSREVSALMNNIYFMWYLIENYNTNNAIKELVDNNELYFVPVVNPDGLRWNEHLSSSGGGMQRKNCRPSTGGNTNSTATRGVDLNRNFDYFWGYNNIGSSGTQADSDYRGPSAASEPETQIMVDFILNRNFETSVWNHSYANSVPHPYGGIPTLSSGREDEFYSWHEEMTRYNRYLYGATIFYESNGLPDDWMAGSYDDGINPPVADLNGSFGSGQGILGTTPEHGGSSSGFWPSNANVILNAERSMRISFATAYYGGKYAKLHDLTQSNITSTTADLDFGIERIGQTGSDFSVYVTAISSNITGVTQALDEIGMSALEQRTVTATLNLDPAITANEKIEYNVKLINDDGIIYDAHYEKHYQPTPATTLIFDHDPDASGLTGWTQSGGWINTTSDSYSGSNSISTGTYSNNATKTLTTTSSYDFSNSSEVIIQFYSKWDIERNYDFVEILGSPDGGSSWISLCGNYTKPNATSATTSHDNKSSTYANFQANSDGQIYDGDRMDNWIMEEITIDNTYSTLLNSSNVKIRFNFRTDALNVNENYTTTNDGFFIDDFKIIDVQIPCDNTNPPTGLSDDIVTSSSAVVSWDNIPSATYDLRYREVSTSTWTVITDISTNSYNITGLTDNTNYEVQVATRCSTTTSSYSISDTFTTAAIVPCTGSSISSFPYSESFENTLGLWSDDNTDDFNWTNKIEEGDGNSTPSAGTGPSLASDGSYFLFIEASNPNFPSKTARLLSPCLDFSGRENATMTFDYHMFGDFIGVLTVDVSTDNGSSYSSLNAYTLSGSQQFDHTDAWKTQNVDLSLYDGQSIKLRFSATTDSDTGNGWSGDISIDNFGITSDVASSSTPPTAVCQNINVQLDATGSATIIPSQIDNGSSDDVAITNYSLDIDTFDCSNIGTPVTVTLTVEDGDAQTDTCTASVTVLDQIKPTFVNVPININLTCGTNNPIWTDPTATDNCDTTLTVNRTDLTGLNSGSIFPSGITTISYEVTDDSGNTQTDSFNVNIVVDSIDPVAVTQNISVQLDAGGNATIVPADINNGSSDNCGIGSLSLSIDTFDCSNIGSNTVVLTVTDTNGNTDNANATVTITQQASPPIVNCWDNFVYNSTSCLWENTGTQPAEPTTECWETATFNDTTCVWDVTISDSELPIAVCMDITVELDEFGNTTIVGTDVDGGSTDNCGIVTYSVTPNTFTLANLGLNTVTLTVIDAVGNTDNCTATIEVIDPTLEIDENEFEQVAIYPNPFNDYVIIKLPQSYLGDTMKIELLDIRGRLIKRLIRNNINGIITLNDFTEFEDASYFIKITNGSGYVTFKQLIKD